MTEREFAYWLQGFAELTEDVPTAAQWKSIREHLGTVFVKVTPPVGLPQFPPHTGSFKDLLSPPTTNCAIGRADERLHLIC